MNPLPIALNIPFIRLLLSPSEFRDLATGLAAQPKRKLAEVLAKAQAGIETLTGAEYKTFQNLWVLAMSMTRRSFLNILTKGLPMLGFSPKLPLLAPIPEDDALMTAIIKFNQQGDVVNHFISFFFDISGSKGLITALDRESKFDIRAAAKKQVELIKTLPAREDLRRVVNAVRTGDFRCLQDEDGGIAHYMRSVLSNDGLICLAPDGLKFLLEQIIPRIGLRAGDLSALKGVEDHCLVLSQSAPRVRTQPKSRSVTEFTQYLIHTEGAGNREHYQESVLDYQPAAPERGD